MWENHVITWSVLVLVRHHGVVILEVSDREREKKNEREKE